MYVLSRIKVKFLGLAGKMLKFPKPFSFVGPDASLSLVREIIGLGVRRVMVITDAQLYKLGIVDPRPGPEEPSHCGSPRWFRRPRSRARAGCGA